MPREHAGPLRGHPVGGRAPSRVRADVAYNWEVARERIVVEHTIHHIRQYQAVSQTDRHHRRHHEARMCSVGGLVNRQIDRHCAG